MSPIAHRAKDNLDASSVINAVATYCIDQSEGLKAAYFEGATGLELSPAVKYRVFTWVGLGPNISDVGTVYGRHKISRNTWAVAEQRASPSAFTWVSGEPRAESHPIDKEFN
jgi:hypothetical protein